MARYQSFVACWLALLVLFSAVGVNAYAGFCACRGQNFVSFLYKNKCCMHNDAPQCCLNSAKICKKTDFQTSKTGINASNCCEEKSFYSNVSAEVDKLPSFGFGVEKLAFMLPKFIFYHKNAAKQFFYPVKVKTAELKTHFINWLPPPALVGKELLNFCQIYRC